MSSLHPVHAMSYLWRRGSALRSALPAPLVLGAAVTALAAGPRAVGARGPADIITAGAPQLGPAAALKATDAVPLHRTHGPVARERWVPLALARNGR